MKNINIFVYGSLREGFFNYDKYLKGKVNSIRPAKIDKMIVYHMPYKGYPAIVEADDFNSVYGEIMEIKPEIYDETMEAMDKMEGFISEGNPKNEYDKKLLEVVDLNTSVKEECYVYFYNKNIDDRFDSDAEHISHGDWVKHMTSK